MNPYITTEQLRVFENETGYKNIINANIMIGKYLDFKPEVEWMVGTEGSSCFHPKQMGYHDERSQKAYAEKWLKEQNERFPEGWVTKENYKVIKREYYPNFHYDWNHLIEAIKRFNIKHKQQLISVNSTDWSIFDNWSNLLIHISI